MPCAPCQELRTTRTSPPLALCEVEASFPPYRGGSRCRETTLAWSQSLAMTQSFLPLLVINPWASDFTFLSLGVLRSKSGIMPSFCSSGKLSASPWLQCSPYEALQNASSPLSSSVFWDPEETALERTPSFQVQEAEAMLDIL